MNDSKKILILYASYGDGHLQASRALKEFFEQYGSHEVVLVDLIAEANPVISRFTRFLYIKSFTILPLVYGWIYYMTNRFTNANPLLRIINNFGSRALKRIIQLVQPDLVINTFPMLAMPVLREKLGLSIPTCTVLTDFSLHSRWVHPNTDKFYVATDALKEQLISKWDIPADRIEVSGIPLKKSFRSQLPSDEMYQRYGLVPGKKTLLIMAGAHGVLQNLRSVCRSVLKMKNVQVIVVCGKNKGLYEDLSKEFSGSTSIRILGFVEEIPDLMCISDCIVTKPGGITLSESLTLNLPILVFRPVPGQELDNAKFLVKEGAAMISYRVEELTDQITGLLLDEQRLNRMRQAAAKLQKMNATEIIVIDMLQNMEEWKRDIQRKERRYNKRKGALT